MSYDIIITPDAITTAGEIHRAETSTNDALVEILYRLWEDAMKATNSPAPFDQTDETEAGRSANYAFDEVLAADVANGKQLTTQDLVNHLQNLNCQNPREVISLFLQSRAQFHFHVSGSVLMHLLHLGEFAMVAHRGENDEDDLANKAEFQLKVANNATTLNYAVPFAIKKIEGKQIVKVEIGSLHAAVTVSADNKLTFAPIVVKLDETKPEVQEIIQPLRRNAPEAGAHTMIVDARAIQARQDVSAVYEIQLTQAAFEQSATVKAADTPVHHRLIDTMGQYWQKLVDEFNQENLVFTAKDEEEAARGTTYAFDKALADQVSEDNSLTIAHIKNHLLTLGCQNPDKVIAILLQTRGGFAFRFGGTMLNRVMMDLGERLSPVLVDEKEGEAAFKVEVTSDGTTHIVYEHAFSLKELDDDFNPYIIDNVGKIRTELQVTADNKLILNPISIKLDRNIPEARQLENKIKDNSASHDQQHQLQIDAKVVNAFENKAKHKAAPKPAQAQKPKQASQAKSTQAKKSPFPWKPIKSVLKGIAIGTGLGLLYLGLAYAGFAIVTSLALSTGVMALAVTALAVIAIAATLLAAEMFADTPAKSSHAENKVKTKKPLAHADKKVSPNNLQQVKENKNQVEDTKTDVKKIDGKASQSFKASQTDFFSKTPKAPIVKTTPSRPYRPG